MRMAAELVENPLGIKWIATRAAGDKDPSYRETRAAWHTGRRWRARLADEGVFHVAPDADLALSRELLVGLVNLVAPLEQVSAPLTIEGYVKTINDFVAVMSAAGHHGGAEHLTRAHLAAFLIGSDFRAESHARRLLCALDRETGVLREDVRALVNGRIYNTRPRRAQLAPYSETEWAALAETSRAVADRAYADWRECRELAKHGGDPGEHGFALEHVCWALLRRGPMRLEHFMAEYGVSRRRLKQTEGAYPVILRANQQLFLCTDTVIAYQLAFGVYTGMVPDGIASLGLGGVDWAGDSAVLLDYVKGRTSAESVALSRQAVRLLEQWLDHSSLARAIAPVELRDHLWLRHEYLGPTPGWSVSPIAAQVVAMWAKRHGLVGDDGARLSIHRHKIRTSFEALCDRRVWTGSNRTLIDPNHSARVEGERYLDRPTVRQREVLDEIIAGAQADLLRKAKPPVVLTNDQVVDLAAQFPELVAAAALDDTAIAELCGGERDVFAAGCADPLSGQFGRKGQPCPARPWVCLLCPLAVFAPRHLPNLLRLRSYFTRAFQAMPASQFMAVFGYYAQRADRVLAAFDAQIPAAVAAAGREVADSDDELPLLPEERTA